MKVYSVGTINDGQLMGGIVVYSNLDDAKRYVEEDARWGKSTLGWQSAEGFIVPVFTLHVVSQTIFGKSFVVYYIAEIEVQEENDHA